MYGIQLQLKWQGSICLFYGTSVPSKRLFSLSGHIAQNQLLPENVNKLFFGKKHGLTLFLYIALYNRDHFYNCNQNMKQ